MEFLNRLLPKKIVIARRLSPPILVSVVAFAACDSSESGSPSDEALPPLDSTTSIVRVETRVVYQDTGFRAPSFLAQAGESLIVLTPYSRPAVRVVDLSSGALINSIDGPGRGGFLHSAIVAEDAIWIGDTGRQNIVAIPLDRLHEPLGWDELLSIAVPQRFASLVGTVPAGFFFASVEGGGAHFIMSASGSVVSSNVESDLAMPELGIQPFLEVMALDRSRDSFLAAGKWWSGVTLYRIDGTDGRAMEVPLSFTPDFDIVDRYGMPTTIPGPDARVGYVSVVAGTNSFFGLYSGNHHYGAGERAFAGTVIHEFDHEGLVASYQLATAVRAIAAAEGGGGLYALAWGDSPSILEVVLP